MPTFNIKQIPTGIQQVLDYLQAQVLRGDRGEFTINSGTGEYILYMPVLEKDKKACPLIASLDCVEIWFGLNEPPVERGGSNVKQ